MPNFTLIAQKSARQTFLSLKDQRDRRRDALVQCMPRAWHKDPTGGELDMYTLSSPPTPSPCVCSPFSMTNAQVAAESTETLPRTVCRWIIALLCLLSLLVSAWGDQRVLHDLEDPKPGMKLHPQSFPSQAVPGCHVSFTGSVLRHVMCPTHHMWPLSPQREGPTVGSPVYTYHTCHGSPKSLLWKSHKLLWALDGDLKMRICHLSLRSVCVGSHLSLFFSFLPHLFITQPCQFSLHSTRIHLLYKYLI